MTAEGVLTGPDRVLRALRSVPARFWGMAVVWALVVWCFAAGSAQYRLAEPWVGNAIVQVAGAVVSAMWPVVLVATATAPLVALVWPWPAAGLAASGLLLSLGVSGTPSVLFATFLALLGVAVSAMWPRPGAAVVIAGLSLGVPVALAVGAPMVMPGGALQSTYWALGQRILAPLLYAVAVALVLAGAWALRSTVRTEQTRQELDLRARAVSNEATAVSERAQIARDLHDVVAHRISLIAVRAETAPYTHPGLDDDARGLLADTASDARAALEEMREVLGVLHRTTDAPTRLPQSGAEDIIDLATRARAAGAEVTLLGEVPVINGAAGHTAYRVVQEALTNSRRHAPGAPATLSFDHEAGEILVTVSNPAPDGDITFGRGLTGMRERVELIGGSLNVRRHDGHFVIRARLPESTT